MFKKIILFSCNPVTLRTVTLLIMLGLLLTMPANGALAQDGTGISEAFSNVVATIIDIIQSLTVGVGILGVTIWGFGKVARPVFPEIAGLTQQYISQFLVGVVAVFIAATVVEGLAAALGGS